MTTNACPCNSDKPFSGCCEPLLSCKTFAKTPVQLMRSRYSAYTLGGYGDYLLETWVPSAALGLSAADLSIRSVTWVSLTVLSKSQQGESGFVEFKAVYLDESGQQGVHHEESVFSRIKGRWFYVGQKTG
ncbi:MAG: SEC-C motif-containing protein [Cryomorphaceae bacterium]|jgi:SEC-C motif-containing protein